MPRMALFVFSGFLALATLTTAGTRTEAGCFRVRAAAVVHRNKAVVQEVIVPFAVPVAVLVANLSYPQTYYGYSQYAAQYEVSATYEAQRLAAKAAEYAAQAAKLYGANSRVSAQACGACQPACVPVCPPVASPGQPANPPAEGEPGSPTNPLTPSVTVKSLLVSQCVSCHGGATPAAGTSFEGGKFSDLTEDFQRKVLARMTTDDESKRMPKGKPPLTMAEIKSLTGE